MHKITLEQRIRRANDAGHMALIPFITAGYPDKQRFVAALRELDENGADIIEIGVPFSDPVADGPVVEAASREVLEAGMNLEWILQTLRDFQPALRAGVVLMGYYNPFLQYGLDKMVRVAAACGVQGLIVPDLPLGEDEPLRSTLRAESMDLIALVGPNTPEARMAEYAQVATGYVYVVSVMGTTGVRADLPGQAAQTLARAKRSFSLPVALGFGLKNPEQLNNLAERPHAAVFGSALLLHLKNGGSAKEFMAPWLN